MKFLTLCYSGPPPSRPTLPFIELCQQRGYRKYLTFKFNKQTCLKYKYNQIEANRQNKTGNELHNHKKNK